jgi:glycine hydroxymethyltransferase
MYRDRVEAEIRQRLGIRFELSPENIDVRPISGTNANAAVYSGLLKKHDRIMTLSLLHGGHVSHSRFGILGSLGVDVFNYPFDDEHWNLDVTKTINAIEKIKPKMLTFYGSVMLDIPPVNEIVSQLSYRPIIHCDIAHLLGFAFCNSDYLPFPSNIDVITASTQKTFPAKPGGLIMIYNDELVDDVRSGVFPKTTCHDHGARLPAFLRTMDEMDKYGNKYCRNMVNNANCLAKELTDYGFCVVKSGTAFTNTHQVLIHYSEANRLVKALEKNHIIANKNLGAGDYIAEWRMEEPSYIRLGTQEVTRKNMGFASMEFIAEKITDVVKNKDVKQEVINHMQDYQEISYCELEDDM